MIRIRVEEYDLLSRMAFLLSDVGLARSNPHFAIEMDVDQEENIDEAIKLTDKWEALG